MFLNVKFFFNINQESIGFLLIYGLSEKGQPHIVLHLLGALCTQGSSNIKEFISSLPPRLPRNTR